jgi:hypothetical protein
MIYGSADAYGVEIVNNTMNFHNLHATIQYR